MTKRALITGITGQDGSYLAELLLATVTVKVICVVVRDVIAIDVPLATPLIFLLSAPPSEDLLKNSTAPPATTMTASAMRRIFFVKMRFMVFVSLRG